VDGLEITDLKDLLRQPYKFELIADHSLNQNNHYFTQVVPNMYLIFTLELLKALALIEQHL